MKKILIGISKFFLMLWQLPQEVVGAYILLWCFSLGKVENVESYKTSKVFKVSGFRGGMSLGQFVFIDIYDTILIKHEYGHSVQSKILGPLYLLVIGIPSLIWACIYKNKWKKSYYWFYTERWANKLGGLTF